jgi:hypothetical protein
MVMTAPALRGESITVLAVLTPSEPAPADIFHVPKSPLA